MPSRSGRSGRGRVALSRRRSGLRSVGPAGRRACGRRRGFRERLRCGPRQGLAAEGGRGSGSSRWRSEGLAGAIDPGAARRCHHEGQAEEAQPCLRSSATPGPLFVGRSPIGPSSHLALLPPCHSGRLRRPAPATAPRPIDRAVGQPFRPKGPGRVGRWDPGSRKALATATPLAEILRCDAASHNPRVVASAHSCPAAMDCSGVESRQWGLQSPCTAAERALTGGPWGATLIDQSINLDPAQNRSSTGDPTARATGACGLGAATRYGGRGDTCRRFVSPGNRVPAH